MLMFHIFLKLPCKVQVLVIIIISSSSSCSSSIKYSFSPCILSPV